MKAPGLMTSSNWHEPNNLDDDSRFARIRRSSTLAGPAFDRWRNSTLGVIGAGSLGSRFAIDAVRSGANIRIYDFDHATSENLGTQCLDRDHGPKVEIVREQCDRIRPGATAGIASDIRHIGIGELQELTLIIDCTDDPNLEFSLTEISNGLAIPMLRLAVDGSGDREFGRVQSSHGGGRCSCRLCGKSWEEMSRNLPKTPCTKQESQSQPTITSNAIASVVTGVGLMCAMRIVGGNEPQTALNRHIFLDLDNFQSVPFVETRNADCISGHVNWALARLKNQASETDVPELIEIVEQAIGPIDSIEFYGHPVCQGAVCVCGQESELDGTEWAPRPICNSCKIPMSWKLHTRKSRWSRGDAISGKSLRHSLVQLGLPEKGAMIVARKQGCLPSRFVMD